MAGEPQPPEEARSLLGRPEAARAALCQGAGGSFRESEPRPADPGLFMLGQLNGPH